MFGGRRLEGKLRAWRATEFGFLGMEERKSPEAMAELGIAMNSRTDGLREEELEEGDGFRLAVDLSGSVVMLLLPCAPK